MAASASPLSRLGEHFLPIDRPDLALDLELLADGLGEIDIEAGQRALLVEIMEGRIVAVGDEAELVEPVHVGLGAKHVALPGVGNDVGLGLGRGGGWAAMRASRSAAQNRQRSHNDAPRLGSRRSESPDFSTLACNALLDAIFAARRLYNRTYTVLQVVLNVVGRRLPWFHNFKILVEIVGGGSRAAGQ